MQRCPTYINGIPYLPQFEHTQIQERLYSAEILLSKAKDCLDACCGTPLIDEIEAFLEDES